MPDIHLDITNVVHVDNTLAAMADVTFEQRRTPLLSCGAAALHDNQEKIRLTVV